MDSLFIVISNLIQSNQERLNHNIIQHYSAFVICTCILELIDEVLGSGRPENVIRDPGLLSLISAYRRLIRFKVNRFSYM